MKKIRSITVEEKNILVRNQCRFDTTEDSSVVLQIIENSDNNYFATQYIHSIVNVTFGPNVILIVEQKPTTSNAITEAANRDHQTQQQQHPSIHHHRHSCKRILYNIAYIQHSIVSLHTSNVICNCSTAIEYTNIIGTKITVQNIASIGVVVLNDKEDNCFNENSSTCTSTISSNKNKNELVDYFETKFDVTVGPESKGCGRHIHSIHPGSTMKHITNQLYTTTDTDMSSANTPNAPTVLDITDVKNLFTDGFDTESVLCCSCSSSSYFRNVIATGCTIRNCSTITNIVLQSHCTIQQNCNPIHTVYCLSGCCIENNCTVSNSIFQWNCRVTTNSVVDTVFAMESCCIGPSAPAVMHSVYGPGTHTSCGEVHTSVLGPNVNMHHQSLCIANLWCAGRGNIGYGANVGSNHTGRLPDQECCTGEGVFYGLSCIVTYPVNTHSAPYSLIAAGTTLSSGQCITLPFSLLVPNNSSSTTTIVPGWVYKHSLYTIVRNETKFRERNKTSIPHHHLYLNYGILERRDIIELCCTARWNLQQVLKERQSQHHSSSGAACYGTCELSTKNCKSGIEIYTDIIQLYILRGLYKFLVRRNILANNNDANNETASILQELLLSWKSHTNSTAALQQKQQQQMIFPWDYNNAETEQWKYQLQLLHKEFPIVSSSTTTTQSSSIPHMTNSWIHELLQTLLHHEEVFYKRVYDCKHRDDVRGSAVIHDYHQHHVAAADDVIIQQCEQRFCTMRTTIQSFLTKTTSNNDDTTSIIQQQHRSRL